MEDLGLEVETLKEPLHVCDAPIPRAFFFFLNNVREQCPCTVTQTVYNTVHCVESVASIVVRTLCALSSTLCI